MPLNPRQVEAFHHVMLRGSVTGAAAVLGVSQPAVSRLVRDLEVRTGVKLFERHGNHLVPTPEATLLLVEVERYAQGMQAISRFAEDLRHRRRGTLRIVSLPAMAAGFLPRFVAQFIKGRQLGHVHVHGMPSHLVVEAIASGQADVGVVASATPRPGLEFEPLGAAAVLAVPVGHRLAGKAVARPKDLAGESFVQLAEPTIFTARVETILGNLTRETAVSTPLSGIACSFVAAGTGIALVDPFSAAEYAGRGVATIPFKPRIELRTSIVTATHRPPSALAQEFVRAFRAHVRAHVASVEHPPARGKSRAAARKTE